MTTIAEQLHIKGLTENSDVLIALSVVGILILMIIPLPRFLLDILLSFDITLAVVILLVAMYVLKPLDFSIFPSLLLVATLFRLSLNIASTRLILLHGSEGPDAAGKVIKAFGAFVVGGNYVVGMIIFFILVVINFVVITKGAGRVSEVAARFTLDAMPGKQMSIDADLNAGLIDDQEARRRRKEIEREADFYGAMDGASKFVRGDAIAGIVITLINILGGLIIGVAQQGMPIVKAAQTYTLLTVGDGLVSQIPALIISTAAGMVVTRAAAESNMGKEMVSQVLFQPRAISIAAGIILFFGLVPGLPSIPFFTLAGVMGAVAYAAHQAAKKAAAVEVPEEGTVPALQPEPVESLLPLDILGLEVGYGLIPIVDREQNGELLDRIRSIRNQFAVDLGIIVPPMHIRDNLQLKPGEYVILLKGNDVGRGELMLGHYLAMDPGTAKGELPGIPTREPAFGLPAFWIEEKNKDQAQFQGYTVVDHSTIIATHISEIVRRHAHELLGRQETQTLIDNLAQQYPKVVEELIPNLLSLGEVQKVLQNLLRERVSIRDLRSILETLADYAPMTKNVVLLTEYVRQTLARSITRQVQQPDGTVNVMTLAPALEEKIAGSIKHTERESYLALDPKTSEEIIMKLQKAMETFAIHNLPPVILCSPVVRPHLRRLIERFIPDLVVLSHNELSDTAKVKSLGVVGGQGAD